MSADASIAPHACLQCGFLGPVMLPQRFGAPGNGDHGRAYQMVPRSAAGRHRGLPGVRLISVTLTLLAAVPVRAHLLPGIVIDCWRSRVGYGEVRLAARDLHLCQETHGQRWQWFEPMDPRPSGPAEALVDWLQVVSSPWPGFERCLLRNKAGIEHQASST